MRQMHKSVIEIVEDSLNLSGRELNLWQLSMKGELTQEILYESRMQDYLEKKGQFKVEK